MTIRLNSIVGGVPVERRLFQAAALFYPDYRFTLGAPGPLEVAQAIGNARSAEFPTLSERIQALQRAAQLFSFEREHLEHTTRLTGMPITEVERAYTDIPRLLRSVSQVLQARFHRLGKENESLLEVTVPGLYRMLAQPGGFCYAITPGLDPRAAAIAAGNLALLGIPFILRASYKDCAAPLVLQALFEAGFDPRCAALLYLDRDSPDFQSTHFKLVDSASVLWTFGPREAIDPTLRYERTMRRAVVDLEDSEPQTPEAVHTAIEKAQAAGKLRVEDVLQDHFAGKIVLRHETGSSALIASGPFDEHTCQVLQASTGYAVLCTAARSVFTDAGPQWIEAAVDFYTHLKTGDPLDPQTQAGCIHPRDLDHLQGLLRKHALHMKTYGGERLSEFQMSPTVVVAKDADPQPAFGQTWLGTEIPTYVLALQPVESVEQAAAILNTYTQERPRLAVALVNVPAEKRLPAIRALRATTVLIDLPTTTLVPSFHEGNDYALSLSQAKVIVDGTHPHHP